MATAATRPSAASPNTAEVLGGQKPRKQNGLTGKHRTFG